jgi:hypothetical protein
LLLAGVNHLCNSQMLDSIRLTAQHTPSLAGYQGDYGDEWVMPANEQTH